MRYTNTILSSAIRTAMAAGLRGIAPLHATATAKVNNSPRLEKKASQYDFLLTTLIARFMSGIASGIGMVRIPVNGICNAMIGGSSKLKGKLTGRAGIADTKLTDRLEGLKASTCQMFPIQRRISRSLAN